MPNLSFLPLTLSCLCNIQGIIVCASITMCCHRPKAISCSEILNPNKVSSEEIKKEKRTNQTDRKAGRQEGRQEGKK